MGSGTKLSEKVRLRRKERLPRLREARNHGNVAYLKWDQPAVRLCFCAPSKITNEKKPCYITGDIHLSHLNLLIILIPRLSSPSSGILFCDTCDHLPVFYLEPTNGNPNSPPRPNEVFCRNFNNSNGRLINNPPPLGLLLNMKMIPKWLMIQNLPC